MHRAQPTASKICEQRNRERAYKLHMKKLKNMKSSLNTKAPKKRPHLKRNLKKMQLEQENFERIKYENQLLLNKMTDIMEKKYIDNDNKNAKYIHSLNRGARKKELMRITKENQAILKRIQKKQPVYNHVDWERDRQKNEQLLKNICQYPVEKDRSSLRPSMRPQRMSQYPEHTMESYEEPEPYEREPEEQPHELPSNDDVDELIDQVDQQLEEAGLRDDEDPQPSASSQQPESVAQVEAVPEVLKRPPKPEHDPDTRICVTMKSAELKENLNVYASVQLAPGEAVSDPSKVYDHVESLKTGAAKGQNPKWSCSFNVSCNRPEDVIVITLHNADNNEVLETSAQKLSDLRFGDDVVVSLKMGGSLKFSIGRVWVRYDKE